MFLGLQRAALDWRFSQIDRDTIAGLMSLLDQELRRLGIGTATAADWVAEPGTDWQTDPLISNHPIGGYHHIGTTRMAANPREGVVDGDCRVYGAPNLYIAGSSVFPTSGWANPTATIIAPIIFVFPFLYPFLTISFSLYIYFLISSLSLPLILQLLPPLPIVLLLLPFH